MPLDLHHSHAARNDLQSIWRYVARDSQSAADALLRKIASKIKLLSEKPEIGRARTDLGAVRSIPMDRYVIYYRQEGKTLHIIRILSAYQNITPEILGE